MTIATARVDRTIHLDEKKPMTILHRPCRLAMLGFLVCGLAASSAVAQRTTEPVSTTVDRGTVVAANAEQGLVTIKTTGGRLIQFRAFGSAGPGARSTIPASVVTTNTSILQRAIAHAYCTDLQGWLNLPPPQIPGFPYTFPDIGPEWTCKAVAVTNQATGRPDWKLGFSCKCEPAFPY